MYTTLLTSLEQGILTITINRPDKLNALNTQVFTDIQAAVNEVSGNPIIKAAIITGAGKAFVAGADITEFNELTTDQAMALAARGQNIFAAIENCSKPIVAAVNGFALGGGCELAMACHFRIASELAKFGQPEVNLGLIPGYGGTQRLAQIIGKGKALELQMTGAIITADAALQLGLVNYVVPAAELLAYTTTLLQTIITKAPIAIAQIIQATNAYNTATGYQQEVQGFGVAFNTADRVEGTTAFLQKRTPTFTGN